MKAQELRIGNWFYEFGIPTQADGRIIDRLHQIDLRGKTAIDVSPIPLTPEILEKCGFEFEDNDSNRYGWYKRLNKHFCFSWCHLEFISIEDSDSNVLIDIPSSYVHQLQNIAYAFTGEELEFKL